MTAQLWPGDRAHGQMGAERLEKTDKYSDIIDLYSGRVFNLASRMLGNREDAEEATQDVFIRVFKSLDNFRGDSTMSTWIWRIATNVCISILKRRKITAVSLGETEMDPPDGKIGNVSGPEEALFKTERRVAIENYLALLPAVESAALTLFYMEGLSYREISKALEVPVGTVSVEIHRGRRKLREIMKDRMEEI